MKITVLMPVYNAEDYLKESIESILNQTFRNFEFLIINDGSTDRSDEIILSYDDPRIVYIKHEKNVGYVRHLNFGLENAKGEYIARMDADDIAFPERLEKRVKFMDNHQEVGICGSWVEAFGISNEIWKRPVENSAIEVELLFNNALHHPSVMLRKSLLDKNRLRYREEFIYSEDYDLWARAAGKFQFHNLPEPLLHYRTHDQQVSKTKQDIQRRNTVMTHRDLIERIGIIPSESEMDIHESLSYREFRCEKDYINRAEKWMKNLIESNARSKAYDRIALQKKAFEKLTLLFENCPDVDICPGKRIASSIAYWRRKKFLMDHGGEEMRKKDIYAHILDRIFTSRRMVNFYNSGIYKRLWKREG